MDTSNEPNNEMPRDGIPPTELAPNDLPPTDPVDASGGEPIVGLLAPSVSLAARVGDRAVVFRTVDGFVKEHAAIVTQFVGAGDNPMFRLTEFAPMTGPEFLTARQFDTYNAALAFAELNAAAIVFAVRP